jgi:hypothetical protein
VPALDGHQVVEVASFVRIQDFTPFGLSKELPAATTSSAIPT